MVILDKLQKLSAVASYPSNITKIVFQESLIKILNLINICSLLSAEYTKDCRIAPTDRNKFMQCYYAGLRSINWTLNHVETSSRVNCGKRTIAVNGHILVNFCCPCFFQGKHLF